MVPVPRVADLHAITRPWASRARCRELARAGLSPRALCAGQPAGVRDRRGARGEAGGISEHQPLRTTASGYLLGSWFDSELTRDRVVDTGQPLLCDPGSFLGGFHLLVGGFE